jgi:hypothetical protein
MSVTETALHTAAPPEPLEDDDDPGDAQPDDVEFVDVELAVEPAVALALAPAP